MTKQQLSLLTFLREFIDERGYSPSFEEMRVGLHLGSKGGIARLVDALVGAGYIRRERGAVKGAARGIVLTDAGCRVATKGHGRESVTRVAA